MLRVYDDVTSGANELDFMRSLEERRWFRREWTLQELVAP